MIGFSINLPSDLNFPEAESHHLEENIKINQIVMFNSLKLFREAVLQHSRYWIVKTEPGKSSLSFS